MKLERYLMRQAQVRRFAWRLGRRVYKSARGEQLADSITTSGESLVQASVAKAIPRSTPLVALDIGANLGEWTSSLIEQIGLAQRDAGFSVDLFEPAPGTADLLTARLAAEHSGHPLRIHRVAMSAAPGEARMTIYANGAGTNTLHDTGAGPGTQTSVPLATVDEFCRKAGIAHVHLAKCDTEGHDLAVLRGARGLLAEEQIDVFQFEYNHRWIFARSYLLDVFNLVEGLPYKVARVGPDGLEVFDRWHQELERFFQGNYALVRLAALDWFPLSRGSFDPSNAFVTTG